MSKESLSQTGTAGFAAIEAVLVLVVVAAIVGIGGYVLQQKRTANSTPGAHGSSSLAQSASPPGTTASIDQLSQHEAQSEAGVDKSADSQAQQSVNANTSADSNVGGAYDENTL